MAKTPGFSAFIRGMKATFPAFAEKIEAGHAKRLEAILPPMKKAEIENLESTLEIALPDSYKQFLRHSRGFVALDGALKMTQGHPFFHRFRSFESLTLIQQQKLEEQGRTWPPPSHGMLCFAEFFVETEGDQVLFDVTQGLQDGEYAVYYYDRSHKPAQLRKISDSFGAWLNESLDYFAR